MGRKDAITKKYLEQDDIFADAFNYFLFDGKQVIKPNQLKGQDTTEISIIEKMGKVFANQKMRDVLKLCTIRHSKYATLVLLGIEGQASVSYIMPVRDYLYDALNYAAQVERIRKSHVEKGDLGQGAEFLSGFTGEDKLLPVITLCVCFDKAKWDAPRSLYDMFGEIDPHIRKYVNNYEINLITPEEIKDFSKFSSELGIAMEFIQRSSDKEKFYDIIGAQDKYRKVDVRTIDIINIYTNAKIPKINAEGGKVDMCTAIEGLIEDGREEGENRLIKLLKIIKPDSKDYEKVLNGTAAQRRQLYKKYNIID